MNSIASISILALVFQLGNAALLFPRIVNGTNAEPGEFPFIGSVQKLPGAAHLCGGSIINSEWVITAAHCVVGNQNPDIWSFQYGNVNLMEEPKNIAYVSRVIVHENYYTSNDVEKENDVALLKLREPLIFDENTQPITLPLPNAYTPGGTPVTLIGFGKNQTDGWYHDHLQKANLVVFSMEECRARHYEPIHDTNLCAGVPDGWIGQCNGDSGGPLLNDGVMVGVVSWSIKPCAVYPFPGVYSQASAFVDWIYENIAEDISRNL